MKLKLNNIILPLFILPILVGCGEVKQEENTYNISFVENDHAYAINLPDRSKEGEQVSFKIATDQGYEVLEVACYSNETPIELVGSLNEGFTFTMPALDVSVEVKTQGFYFDIKADGTLPVFTTSSTEETFRLSDFIGGYRVNNTTVEELSTTAKVGDTVYVLVNKLGFTKNFKVFANDIEATHTELEIKDIEGRIVDFYNAYEFVMPANHVNITATCEENNFIVDVNYSHPGAATTTILNKQGEVTNSFIYGKRIYCNLTIEASQRANYSFNSVKVFYRPYTGYSLGDVNNTEITLGIKETDEFSFLLYDIMFSDNHIHFQVSFNEYEYTDKDFLGDYKGFIANESRLIPTLDNDNIKNIHVSADGVFKEDYSTYSISNLDETNKTFTIMAGPIPKTVHYDDGIMWYEYTSSKNVIIAWKNYSDSTMFTSKGDFSSLAIINLLNSNSEVINNFVHINGQNYTNVEIEYIYEDDVFSKCQFNLKKDGQVIASYGI